MSREQRFAYYQELAEGQKHTIEKLTKKIYFTGTLRLVVFILGVGAIYFLHRDIHSVIAISILFSILFILLLKKYTFLNEEKRYAAALLKIAEDELKAFDGDYSAFDGAPEQVDASHDFSFDLDIFGERSIFQLLNRTALDIGKERLCDFVKKPLHTSVSIKERQEAVKELALLNVFCLHFRKTGSLVSDGFSSQQQIAEIFTASARFPYRTFWQVAICVVPLLYIVLLALVLAGMVSANAFILLYISTLILSALPSKNILRILQTFNKKNRQIGIYAQLFKLIENTPFKSPLLQKWQSVICEPLEASKVVAKLDTYYRNLDVAFTPALFILNPLWYC